MRWPTQSLVVVACLLMLTVAGCGESDPRGQRTRVRGAVLLDGQPLGRARIVFEAEGDRKVKSTASIVDGFYEIPVRRGPLAGRHRVRIESEPLSLAEFEAARRHTAVSRIDPRVVNIPSRYNTKSELEVVVTRDPSANKFDFELESH